MTTLVTGAAGFAGVHMVRALAEAGERVIALDLALPDGLVEAYLAHVADRVCFVMGDVRDADAMLALAREHAVERVLHGAAITPTAAMERIAPRHIIGVNLMGTVNLLEAARQVGAWRFVFASSSAVYAPATSGATSLAEDSPVQTSGLYTIGKLACESIVERYRVLFGLSTASGRMSSIYGPMERPTATRHRPSAIHSLVGACLNQQPVVVRGKQYRRSFARAEDAAAIWRDLTLAENLAHGTYNVSTGEAYRLQEVLDALTATDPSFAYRYAQEGEPADVEIRPEGERPALDMGRSREEFGFAPTYTLARGIADYLMWAREHPSLFAAQGPSG